jgi:predicted O-methyltransferase YrrM
MSTIEQRAAREDVSNGAGIIAVVGTFTGISALFVAARLYVRIKLMRTIGLDDYLIVLAMVSFAQKTVRL